MGKKTSKVKIKESEFNIEKSKDTTVFSDPKAKNIEPKKKKKWVPVLIIALVCVIIVLPWGLVKLINDNKVIGKDVDPISKRSKVVKEELISDKAKFLFEAINDDPTDIEANDRIAGYLGVTTYCGKHEIEVYESDGGYTMRFVFAKPHSVSTNDVFYDLMLNYSIAFMALVDDVVAVEWTCPSLDNTAERTSEKITIANIEEYLNDSPKEYAKSTRTVQFMLNEHGLNDLTDQ